MEGRKKETDEMGGKKKREGSLGMEGEEEEGRKNERKSGWERKGWADKGRKGGKKIGEILKEMRTGSN